MSWSYRSPALFPARFPQAIRTRREEFAKDRGEVLAILKRGTERASAVAAQTMSEVNAALGLNYFG